MTGRCAIVLLALSGQAHAADPSARSTPEPKLTVVTASAHCDWTWQHSRAWHAERYAEIIRNVLLLMRRHPHYVWQLETENEELAPFLDHAGRKWPELIDEFWRRVREGRIEVIGAISAPRLCEVYPETMVRNLVLGKQFFRRHAPGVEQPVFHAADLMVGHSQMPQVLTQAEYRYFVFSRPSRQKQVFWRLGLDGTRILSALQHYSHGGLQAAGIALESHSGDDDLPSEELALAAAGWDPTKRVLATSARYFQEVERAGGTLPERSGPLDSLESFCCGMGLHGNSNLYTLGNRNEDLLLAVERVQFMASALGARDAMSHTDDLWRDLLSCTGHAILWSWKADYDSLLDKVRQTRETGERRLRDAIAEVASRIRFRGDWGTPLVLFNVHGWPVTGPVEVVVEGDVERLSLRDGDGRDVPWQVCGVDPGAGHRLVFCAEHVPACGYKTFYVARTAIDRGGDRGPHAGAAESVRPQPPFVPVAIENRSMRVEMGDNGRLRITDRVRGIDLGTDDGGIGDVVFHDAPVPKDWMMNGPLGRRHDWIADPGSVRRHEGPVFASLEAEGRIGAHRVRREVRLWRDCRRIDFGVEIEAEPDCGVFYLRFPLSIQGRVFAGIPFGAEPRENVGAEPFRGEYFALGHPDAYYATRWTDVSHEDAGCTFIAPHGMHNGFEYRLAERALEFALLRVRPMPEGDWSQVHPSIQGTGRHRWTCSLVPHGATWRQAATYRDALEFHSPLVAYSPVSGMGRVRFAASPPTDSPGSAADSESFAEVTPRNVVLSSLRCLEPRTGEGVAVWELRLYETTGRHTEATIELHEPVRDVQVTNLLGRPDPQSARPGLAGREVRVTIPPWKIVTLRAVTAATGE